MKWTKKNKVKFLEQRPKSQFKIKHRNVAVWHRVMIRIKITFHTVET
jgi:hypothetical protein